MLKKTMLYLTCLCSIQGGLSSQNRDQHIQELKQTLSHLEALENQEEVKGQGEMIADWEAYRKDLQKIRQLEEKKMEIQKQIEQLEEENQAPDINL